MEDSQYVGFWNRFHSIVVMAIFVSILEMGMGYILYDDMYMSDSTLFSFEDILIGHIIPMIITVVIWIRFSSDFGKMLYKAKIVDATSYEKPTTKQFILRYVGYYISLFPLGLGYFWVIWDSKKQAWHDKLAHTIVIKDKTSQDKIKWYVLIYRTIMSFFIFVLMIGAVIAYFIPDDKPLIKAAEVTKKDITQLLDDGLITNEKELVYYYKTQYMFDDVDTSIISITRDGVCVMNLENSDVSESGCYLYKDIGQFTIDYDENIVYLYDASIYPTNYRYSDEYYDDNSTESGLYLNMTINEEDKLGFRNTVMNLWEKKRSKIKIK